MRSNFRSSSDTAKSGSRFARPLPVALVAGVAGLSLGLGIGFARDSYPPLEVLLKSGETVLGKTIVYPDGTPEVTAAIVTLRPGEETRAHIHDVPLFGWILEGELTVDYGDDGTKLYRTGDALLEAMHTEHNGRNAGDVPVRVLAVFMGADGTPNTVMAD